MKITDVKTALIGHNIVLRIVTDKGIDGYSEFENTKEAYIDALLPFFKPLILGCDPTDVGGIMWRIRRAGAFRSRRPTSPSPPAGIPRPSRPAASRAFRRS